MTATGAASLCLLPATCSRKPPGARTVGSTISRPRPSSWDMPRVLLAMRGPRPRFRRCSRPIARACRRLDGSGRSGNSRLSTKATSPLSEMHVRHNYSRRLVLATIDELAAFLNDQRPTLAKKAGLDEELFIRTVESLGADVPATDADVETFYNAHRERVKDLEALLPWPERLEIDWKKFHPSARTLLDDELFWSESDEFSPHGNDTGHDLFDDLRRWRRSHAAAPPLDFLAREMRSWGFDPAKQDDEIAVHTHDQAAIALAFGLIKLEGSCDPTTRDAALTAIARLQDPMLRERFGWRQPTPDAVAAYSKLRAVLARPVEEPA